MLKGRRNVILSVVPASSRSAQRILGVMRAISLELTPLSLRAPPRSLTT